MNGSFFSRSVPSHVTCEWLLPEFSKRGQHEESDFCYGLHSMLEAKSKDLGSRESEVSLYFPP